MKTRVPVVLALYVVSQCAPLLEVMAEDEEDMTFLPDTSVSLGNEEDQYDEEAVLERLDDSKKKYLNADTGLMVKPQILSAVTDELHKRDAVNVLEEDDGYAWVLDEEGNTGWVSVDLLKDSRNGIFDETDQVMYAVDAVTVYAEPSKDSSQIAELQQNDEVNVTGISEDDFTRIEINGTEGYVLKNSLQDHKLTFSERLKTIQSQPVVYTWNGAVLSTSRGSVYGPSGKETYYNLDMSTVVRVMRSMGFNESEYPYWVRKDGAKMLGPYVMVAADLSSHPKGSTMEISLGTALVCDTGEFAYNGSGTSVDVAVTW